ncbi:hypothetical protein C8J42_103577 [Sphingomonas sp. PP-CE-1A-559]|uniref:phage gp6-like head-tail connector protein n=1 Tax=Sphingomonas sp. PP-CE-1A-559 TaxID=2135657 RepID=UPI001054F036|nr:phage gp6-like head-tail connector protein [Sphingomonas sp. PP-CE-1A-559]TCP91885.1 hypothetical protein C8J42_103577 [Sphingomonas sp. PP-CE-1A-559]
MAIPVSIEDARRQVRLDEDDDSQDADLNVSIVDAAAWVERYTGHILVARDVVEVFRVPPRAVELRAWPVKPDAVPMVTYDDTVAVPGVRLDRTGRPARVLAAQGSCWPLTRTDQLLRVAIRAGYEPGDIVPGNFRRAMLILISAYESDREGGDIFQKAETAAKSLCRDFRARNL